MDFWTAATPDPEFMCSGTVQCTLYTLLLDLGSGFASGLGKEKVFVRPARNLVTAETTVLALDSSILCQLVLNFRL